MRLEEAGERLWDTVVIGAGPAGALAARELARRGTAVLLVDKSPFPRRKVCGCCLNRAALATLAEAGLGSLPTRLGAEPLRRLRLSADRREAELPLPTGAAVSREALDAALVEEAMQAGAEFLPRVLARLAAPAADDSPDRRIQLIAQAGRYAEIRARLVLDAGGLASLGTSADPSSRIGAGAVAESAPDFYEPGSIFMACARGGYVGLVRMESRRLNIACALDPAFVRGRGSLGASAAAILADSAFPAVPGLAELAWRGTPAMTRRRARVASHRLFAVGDAAGFVEPFTGEGIAWAFASAAAAAPLALDASRRWSPAHAAAWERRHRALFRRRQLPCRLVAAGLRASFLTTAAVRLLSHAPQAARRLVERINAPYAGVGLP